MALTLFYLDLFGFRSLEDFKRAEEQFNRVARVAHQIQKPEEIRYLETERSMSKYGKIRRIVIQSGEDKQRSAIYTNGTQEEIGA